MFGFRRTWIHSRFALVCLALVCAAPARAHTALGYVTEEPPRRLALVIGNSDYVNASRLPGSAVDADKMADILQSIEFNVTKVKDVINRDDFVENYLRPFMSKIKEGDIVVFYYSGHGFTFGGENYIAALNFPLEVDSNDIFGTFVSTAGIERQITARRAGLVLMILDACRTIPNFRVKTGDADDSWVAKGLAEPRIDVSSTIYWFSSAVGAISIGSAEKKESVYTEALADNLAVAARELTDVSREVRIAVKFKTKSRQVPWRSDSSSAELYLKPSPEILANQKALWEAVLGEGTKFAVTRFLEINGTGPYGAAARRWLAENPNAPEERPSAVSPIAAEVAWTVNPGGGDVALPRVGGALAAQAAAPQLASAPSSAPAPSIGDLASAQASPSIQTPSLSMEYATAGIGASLDQKTRGQTAARDMTEAAAIADARSAKEFSPRANANASARSLNRLGRAITVGRVQGRAAPTAGTAVTRSLAPGAAVTIDGVTVGANDTNWLRARTAGDDTTFYIEQTSTDLKPIEVGKPALEVSLTPKPDGLRSVVDASPLLDALDSLKTAGTRVTWVSIATPKAQAGETAALLSLRGVYVTSVLAAQGVPRDIVTTSEGASGDDGVRVRIFGKAN